MIEPCPLGCFMEYRGIRGTGAYPHELWECSRCGRQEVRPYTGAPADPLLFIPVGRGSD